MRWVVLAAGLWVAGCTPAVPVTVVQVPGLTPLPLAQRTAFSAYDRNAAVDQCVPLITAPLTPQAKRLACACVMDTLPVYLTAEQVRAHNRRYGPNGEPFENAIKANTPTARVFLACKEQMLGE